VTSDLTSKPRYVALMDILGFKAVLAEYGSAKLAEIYKASLDRVREHYLAMLTSSVTTKQISLLDFSEKVLSSHEEKRPVFSYLERPVIFSDSIMLFSIDDSKNSLYEVVNFANITFQEFLRQRLPLRGAVSFGNSVVDVDAGLYVSDGIVKAHEIEQSLDIIGIVVDPTISVEPFDCCTTAVAMKQAASQDFRIPKFSPDGYAGYDVYAMWASFDKCRETAPESLQGRYKNSEKILSIMVSGDSQDYGKYCELKRLGKEFEAKGELNDD